jgi:alpha-L-fucosidase
MLQPSLMLLSLLLLLPAAEAALSHKLPQGSDAQLHYLDNELTMFMHYSVCTYVDSGCEVNPSGGGQQNCVYQGKPQPWPASIFNPTALDTDQWAQTAVDLGAKQVCLTVHHTGGFALWPTNASNYSIKASPFGATGRDIVKEFVTSMRKHEIEPCFYIILPWDCAEWHDSVEQYFEIQKEMLTELLSNYGPIARLWWDDYGLAGHRRQMRDQQAVPGHNPGGWPGFFANMTAHVHSLQQQTIMLPGPDGCLVGGESGSGSYPVFNFNEGPTRYGCQGSNPPALTAATIFAPHEQDHTILNPGDMWWWVKGHAWLSAAQLFETFLVTIGRGNTCACNTRPIAIRHTSRTHV